MVTVQVPATPLWNDPPHIPPAAEVRLHPEILRVPTAISSFDWSWLFTVKSPNWSDWKQVIPQEAMETVCAWLGVPLVLNVHLNSLPCWRWHRTTPPLLLPLLGKVTELGDVKDGLPKLDGTPE
jgi:hypothetical protein